MEKKMNATTIASNVVSKTTRIRKSPPKLKMEDVDESSYVIKDELLGHELLTADEEKVLGRKIRRAVKLKAAMAEYVEQKKQEELERHLEEESYVDDLTQDLFLDRRSDFTGEGDEDLEGLSVIDYQIIDFQRNRLEAFDRKSLHKDKDIDSWDYDRLRQTSHSTMESDASSLLGSDYSSLTDEEVMEQFGLAGGRDELARIVVEGALAKEKMISCNIRLVVSIAKKWCQRSPAGLTGGLSQYAGSFDTVSFSAELRCSNVLFLCNSRLFLLIARLTAKSR
jgi:DNA-directed RNA polymerase sigma subunit (sigma70/sigma32)